MAANTFTYSGATTAVFPLPPAAGYRLQRVKSQPRDFSLGGTLYLYDRGFTGLRHTLTFKKAPAALLDTLYAFFDSFTHGSRSAFTWYDQANAAHTVRLFGGITAVESHSGIFTITLTLEETS